MSMVINLVEDHNIYLCEGGPVYNGGVQPTPITYLTQWKIVGNSEVHGVGNLTSWKVSGNSIVDNNAILSCGDLGQDGKYHVKISNGVTIFDIPLDAPLRKVNNVADTIEFPSGTEGKALVTRRLGSVILGNVDTIDSMETNTSNYVRWTFSVIDNIKKAPSAQLKATLMCATLTNVGPSNTYIREPSSIGASASFDMLIVYKEELAQSTPEDVRTYFSNTEVIYELATPTTELVDVSPFPVSPTDTYTSANVVPYSAFEHTENKEIWSCGEYNPIDGKYHILVQPLGGSIVDIALTEPLRKVNDVADSIEYADGVTTATRNIAIAWWKDMDVIYQVFNNQQVSNYERFYTKSLNNVIGSITGFDTSICLSANYEQHDAPVSLTRVKDFCMCVFNKTLFIRDIDCHSKADFKAKNANNYFFYVLATPTTELVDAPQIEEAESYSMVISQGGKAVSWSSFVTE